MCPLPKKGVLPGPTCSVVVGCDILKENLDRGHLIG